MKHLPLQLIPLNSSLNVVCYFLGQKVCFSIKNPNNLALHILIMLPLYGKSALFLS